MPRSDKRFYVNPSFQKNDPFVKEFTRRARNAGKTPTTLARDILIKWLQGELHEGAAQPTTPALDISTLAEQLAQELITRLPTLCFTTDAGTEGKPTIIPPPSTKKVEEIAFDEDAALENVELFNLGGL